MDKPLDDLYLEWLYGQVALLNVKNPARSYWNLLRVMYKVEFVWLIANDDNRMEDGRDLRREFARDIDMERPDEPWMTLGCSMLEMLIALSRRLAFSDESDSEHDASEWFWHLMDNLGLRQFNDKELKTLAQEAFVVHILEEVVWRNYQSNGKGGLFPLQHPHGDQREVEIWYQLSSYLIEGHSVR